MTDHPGSYNDAWVRAILAEMAATPGLTRQVVAGRYGTTPSGLSAYLKPDMTTRRPMNMDVVERLAGAMGVPIDRLAEEAMRRWRDPQVATNGLNPLPDRAATPQSVTDDPPGDDTVTNASDRTDGSRGLTETPRDREAAAAAYFNAAIDRLAEDDTHRGHHPNQGNGR